MNEFEYQEELIADVTETPHPGSPARNTVVRPRGYELFIGMLDGIAECVRVNPPIAKRDFSRWWKFEWKEFE